MRNKNNNDQEKKEKRTDVIEERESEVGVRKNHLGTTLNNQLTKRCEPFI